MPKTIKLVINDPSKHDQVDGYYLKMEESEMNCKRCDKMMTETIPPFCDRCMKEIDEELAKMASNIQRSVSAYHWDNPELSYDKLRRFIELAASTKIKIIENVAINIVRSYLIKKWTKAPEAHHTDGEFWLAIELEEKVKNSRSKSAGSS